MLQDNPNLYYDISWVIFDDYINQDEETLKAWADLLMKYPDRFMIGSDKVGHWNGYESEIRKYDPLIALLDEDTRLMVTQTNILDLIHVDPVTMQRVEALAPAA